MERALKRGALEGWQVGAVTVFVATVVTSVVVPRSAVPHTVPPSSLSPNEISATRAELRSEAARAESGELAHAVRLLEARFRAVGRAEASRDARLAARWAGELGSSASSALVGHREEVIALRTFLALEFSRRYLRRMRSGRDDPELLELGGATLDEMAENDWLQRPEQLTPSADLVLCGLFARRFNLMVVPQAPALVPLDDEVERALFAYLMTHPPRARLATNAMETASTQVKFVLTQIDGLSKLERDYPTLFAKGVVLYRAGQYEAAASAFDGYLQKNPDGPYRLRAVNFLKATVEETNSLQ
jgi:hypothetical protein